MWEGNVAHSVGKYGFKISQFFPSVGGERCLSPTTSVPAIFKDSTIYKAGFFGIWMENVVDVHFQSLNVADYGMAGIEAMSVNGKLAQFARSNFSNILFVGHTTGAPRKRHFLEGNFMSASDTREAVDGMRDCSRLDNNYVHAMHMPGTGSELLLSNSTVVRHQAAFVGAAWESTARGGYETSFAGMTLERVGQIATWCHHHHAAWIRFFHARLLYQDCHMLAIRINPRPLHSHP